MAAALLAALPGLLPKVVEILDKVIPDKDAAQKAAQAVVDKVVDLTAQSDGRQAEINKIEAGSDSLFVSGWRPAIGWICAVALAYSYVLVPLVMYASFVIGKPLPKPPVLDANLWELMFGLLGLAGIRTYEKVKGVAR